MDETGKPRGPSDTGERRVREAAAQGARDGAIDALRAANHTPPPLTESRVFEISKQVLREGQPAHWLECTKEGPSCEVRADLEERIAKMERMQTELGERLGAKLDKLAEESAGRKGERAVWTAVRLVVTPLVVAVAVWWLNGQSAQRTEASIKRQSEIAATVAKQLLADQTRSALPQPGPVYK